MTAHDVRSTLQQVLDYRARKGKFDLAHITDIYERDNAAHDLWYDVESDVRMAIDALSAPRLWRRNKQQTKNMTEEQAREKYWEAVSLLNEIIKAGQEPKAEILDELQNDLED